MSIYTNLRTSFEEYASEISKPLGERAPPKARWRHSCAIVLNSPGSSLIAPTDLCLGVGVAAGATWEEVAAAFLALLNENTKGSHLDGWEDAP